MYSRCIMASAIVGVLMTLTGCHSAGLSRSAYGPPPEGLAYGDPLAGPSVGSQVIPMEGSEKPFLDRHPILAAPRNYYRDSSSNIFVKAFYGTVVGIPVGIARETWQVFYGQ